MYQPRSVLEEGICLYGRHQAKPSDISDQLKTLNEHQVLHMPPGRAWPAGDL